MSRQSDPLLDNATTQVGIDQSVGQLDNGMNNILSDNPSFFAQR
jgi:hypothetical protein